MFLLLLSICIDKIKKRNMRSSAPFHIASYYIEWVTTSWANSIDRTRNLNNIWVADSSSILIIRCIVIPQVPYQGF